MKISIRLKVAGLILTLVTVVIFLNGYLFIQDQIEQLESNVDKNAKRDLLNLSSLAAYSLVEQDEVRLVQAIQRINKSKGFLFASVLDANTKKKFTTDDFFCEEIKSNKKLISYIKKNVADKTKHFWDLYSKNLQEKSDLIVLPYKKNSNYKLFVYQRPIYHPFRRKNNKKELLGIVQIGFSNQFIIEKIKSKTIDLVIIAAIFWILSIIAAFILTYFIVKPIKILSEGAAKVGEGDLDYQVPKLGRDELGQLAIQFNKMTKSLKQAQQAKEEQIQLNEQIKQAKEIQEGMNPGKFLNRDLYQLKGYMKAAKGVGGDYYDFQILPDKRLAVLISDVSGKGVSASLVMVLIKTVFLTYQQLGKLSRPDKVISAINQVMASQYHIDKFATFFLYIYNPENKELIFTNGGHGPLYLYRAKDKVFTASKLEGLPLGIDDENEYRLSKTQLHSGDLVVMFTDGINEAWNNNKEEFGLAKVREKIIEYAHLNAKEIVEKLLADIEEFTDGAEQHDDMTIVIMKVP